MAAAAQRRTIANSFAQLPLASQQGDFEIVAARTVEWKTRRWHWFRRGFIGIAKGPHEQQHQQNAEEQPADGALFLIPHHRLAGGTIPFMRRYTTSCP
jgi:hypothetical protein